MADAVDPAPGITGGSQREAVGLRIAETEGARFRLSGMNGLRNRGVRGILIAAIDGLTGCADATDAALPETTVQACIVHLVRHSLKFHSWRERKAVAAKVGDVCSAKDRRGGPGPRSRPSTRTGAGKIARSRKPSAGPGRR